MRGSFSDSTLRELRSELKYCEDRATMLRRLIGEATAAPSETASEPVQRRRGRPRKTQRTIPAVKQPSSDSTGFREALRQVIRQHPGIQRKDITLDLKRTGVQVRGHTTLSTRVYNDLWRMEKNGEVQRDSKGGYLVTAVA